MEICLRRSQRNIPSEEVLKDINSKEKKKSILKSISSILKKNSNERSVEEFDLLEENEELAKSIEQRSKLNQNIKMRNLEIEDNKESLKIKCQRLASAIKKSKYLIIYTGAGISTAASIPDYRGPNGVWTLLKKGKQYSIPDLLRAQPTFTHLAIAELYKNGLVKHVVSQNCDGLHMRTALPSLNLSEVHGNMHVEICRACNPVKEYVRLFDVTENTAMRRHKTQRHCHKCAAPLYDTIVHFGEKGRLDTVYNWHGATKAAKKADLIVCLGTSLKVLKKYSCLWPMSKKPHGRKPQLFIVNLQWTPKDRKATLKISGKCDTVMKIVMQKLKIKVPTYKRKNDPIFKLAQPLSKSECSSTSKPLLKLTGFRGRPKGSFNKATIDSKEAIKTGESLVANPYSFNEISDIKFNTETVGSGMQNTVADNNGLVDTNEKIKLEEILCNNSLPYSWTSLSLPKSLNSNDYINHHSSALISQSCQLLQNSDKNNLFNVTARQYTPIFNFPRVIISPQCRQKDSKPNCHYKCNQNITVSNELSHNLLPNNFPALGNVSSNTAVNFCQTIKILEELPVTVNQQVMEGNYNKGVATNNCSINTALPTFLENSGFWSSAKLQNMTSALGDNYNSVSNGYSDKIILSDPDSSIKTDKLIEELPLLQSMSDVIQLIKLKELELANCISITSLNNIQPQFKSHSSINSNIFLNNNTVSKITLNDLIIDHQMVNSSTSNSTSSQVNNIQVKKSCDIVTTRPQCSTYKNKNTICYNLLKPNNSNLDKSDEVDINNKIVVSKMDASLNNSSMQKPECKKLVDKIINGKVIKRVLKNQIKLDKAFDVDNTVPGWFGKGLVLNRKNKKFK